MGFVAGLQKIGGLELLIDSQFGMGTNATPAPVDLSGKGRVISVLGAPVNSATAWGGAQRAVTCNGATSDGFSVAWPGFAQPYTVIAAFDAWSIFSGDANAYRGSANDAVSYIKGGTNTWALFAGSVFDSTFTMAGSAGKLIRMDVVNNAASIISRGDTEQTGTAGVQGVTGATLFVGRNVSAAFCNWIFGSFIFYSKALDASERARVRALLRAHWTGIG